MPHASGETKDHASKKEGGKSGRASCAIGQEPTARESTLGKTLGRRRAGRGGFVLAGCRKPRAIAALFGRTWAGSGKRPRAGFVSLVSCEFAFRPADLGNDRAQHLSCLCPPRPDKPSQNPGCRLVLSCLSGDARRRLCAL